MHECVGSDGGDGLSIDGLGDLNESALTEVLGQYTVVDNEDLVLGNASESDVYSDGLVVYDERTGDGIVSVGLDGIVVCSCGQDGPVDDLGHCLIEVDGDICGGDAASDGILYVEVDRVGEGCALDDLECVPEVDGTVSIVVGCLECDSGERCLSRNMVGDCDGIGQVDAAVDVDVSDGGVEECGVDVGVAAELHGIVVPDEFSVGSECDSLGTVLLGCGIYDTFVGGDVLTIEVCVRIDCEDSLVLVGDDVEVDLVSVLLVCVERGHSECTPGKGISGSDG